MAAVPKWTNDSILTVGGGTIDDGSPSSPFPESPIGFDLTVQVCLIEPTLAAEWLALRKKTQRRIKQMHLNCLIEDMDAGRWKLNGETIIFDRAGNLIDGQHRLTAVIATGKPIWSLVVRNVDLDAYPSIDVSAKRTGADALAQDHGKSIAGAALLLTRYERGFINKHAFVISPLATQEIVNRNPGLKDSATVAMQARRICGSGVVPTFCHYIFAGKDRARADEFIAKLATGEELAKGNPILLLRSRLLSVEAGRKRPYGDELVHLMFKVWNMWREGRSLLNLRIGVNEMLPEPT